MYWPMPLPLMLSCPGFHAAKAVVLGSLQTQGEGNQKQVDTGIKYKVRSTFHLPLPGPTPMD